MAAGPKKPHLGGAFLGVRRLDAGGRAQGRYNFGLGAARAVSGTGLRLVRPETCHEGVGVGGQVGHAVVDVVVEVAEACYRKLLVHVHKGARVVGLKRVKDCPGGSRHRK